ncbi:hypothetical protein [Stenotrophomonas sp. Marseille-Q5258]|uniref:hypothetical protein n=1 Tax=Stenotrophomonas TaxID=40323 RepID=UPI0021C8153F|nr:hypothetical protein [Stenotrophomonas sp. Marseille-Q5258]
MLQLSAEQYAALCLPDAGGFAAPLAAETRRDFPAETAGRSDADLQLEVGTSYRYAVSALRITHLPVLVRWVKADVAWARGLRDQAITAVWFNETGTPQRHRRRSAGIAGGRTAGRLKGAVDERTSVPDTPATGDPARRLGPYPRGSRPIARRESRQSVGWPNLGRGLETDQGKRRGEARGQGGTTRGSPAGRLLPGPQPE